jgi:hypothetical protein
VHRAHQVDLHHAAEGIGGHAVEARREIPRRARNQHVEIAPCAVHLLKPRLDRRKLPHIGGEAHRLRPEALQRGDGVVDLVLRPAGHGHPRTVPGEQLRDAAIDAAGAADHDHGLAAEIEGDAHDAGPPACASALPPR